LTASARPLGQFETTAAEISRNFGQWQDRAMQAPVRVSHHGRPRVVVISADEFERLTMHRGEPHEARAQSGPTSEPRSERALAGLLANMSEGFIALGADLRITGLNTVAESFLGLTADELIGKPVASIGDPSRAEVFVHRYRWVLRTGEVATFEGVSHICRGRSLRVRAFPLGDGVGVIFTNLTELMTLRDAESRWGAERRALRGHPQVVSAELNLLGFITAANTAFHDFVGFDAEQLAEVRLSDLVGAADRQALAQGINDLLQQRANLLVIDANFLTRAETRRTLRLSIAPIMKNLVFEGLSLLGLPAGG
jgi:prevent-host-death family protein